MITVIAVSVVVASLFILADLAITYSLKNHRAKREQAERDFVLAEIEKDRLESQAWWTRHNRQGVAM